MKRLLFILLSITLLHTSPNTFAQSKKFLKREVALISYNIDIDNSYQELFAPFSGDFRQPNNNKTNPILNQIYYSTWDIIKQTLESQTGMFILPIDSYGKKFNYNEYGFPCTSVNKAINKGESKYYLKFDILIKPEPNPIYTNVNAKADSTSIKLEPNEIQPILTVDITIFSDKGIIPICKTTLSTKAPEALEVNSALFDGFSNEKYVKEPTNLYGLFETTIAKMVGSIFANLK